MKYLAFLIVLIVLGGGYLYYLQTGCGELGGVMTWEGKVCFDNLTD